MPRLAGPIPAPAAGKAAPRPPAPQPRRAGPQRDPLWHAIQLRAAQSAAPAQAAKDGSGPGLAAPLKAGIERLSGLAMDDVRVHRNSAEPAKLGALAFTQGSDVHLGPGQERHLPHEAWHVVQQKQGRVRATRQMKGDAPLNDDPGLEQEADVMGARAAQGVDPNPAGLARPDRAVPAAPIVQRKAAEPVSSAPLIGEGVRSVSEKALDVKSSEIPAEGKGQDDKLRIAALAEAARVRIKLAAAAAPDTIALGAELGLIKAELGLQAIGLVDVGKPSAAVMFQVNPMFKEAISSSRILWRMEGTKKVTNVHWDSSNLSVGTASANVGKHMLANPLAPDHEPGSLSTQDSAQDELMGQLANSGNTSVPNDQKYIKGHLLNDHVGGPGESFNLFPITADANAKHLAYVEKYVKAQLADRYVIAYEILVTDKTATALASSSSTTSTGYSIDSTFDFFWHTLDINGATVGSDHHAQIQSTYNAVGAAPFDVTTEYAGQYDKLNRGKSTPKAIGQTGQWQVTYDSPEMAPMDVVKTSKTPLSMPTGFLGGSSGPSTPTTLDFSDIAAKTDSSGAEFISVRNKDAPASSAVGGTMLVSGSPSPVPVTIKSISPVSGGWTRIYF